MSINLGIIKINLTTKQKKNIYINRINQKNNKYNTEKPKKKPLKNLNLHINKFSCVKKFISGFIVKAD